MVVGRINGVVALTGFSHEEMYGRFAGRKKSGRINEVVVRRGSTVRERQNEMKETLRVITNAAVNLDLSRIIENYLSLEADIAKMLTMLDNLEEKLVVRC